MPINNPREITNKKSNAIVASIIVDSLVGINPRGLDENKLPMNKTDIIMRNVVPITYAK
jgi:hypothetical protein